MNKNPNYKYLCAKYLFLLPLFNIRTPHWTHTHIRKPCSYWLIGPVDPNQEQWLSDEEADAEVFVDGVAVALQAAEEAKREYADK